MSVLWTTGLGSCVVLVIGIWAAAVAIFGKVDEE